ncbi:MAG: hypothetical protein JWL68_2761, partial [Actinomycetia bacterium]|nr:hypothetical protein [Actinomycetes bacterium]
MEQHRRKDEVAPMNDNPRANGSRGHDPYAALRLVALIAAIAGVIVLAAAAFVLSYGGIHKIALSAGVSASMARIFPVIFDAMLVVSCAAVLSLRAAKWWYRAYSWLTTLVLLAVVAAADAAHATGTHIPRKPAAATIAVLPWVLLLLAFSLLLAMLRQFRRTRALASQDVTAAAEPETAAAVTMAPATTGPATTGPATTAAATTGHHGLEILERRGPAPQPAPARTATQPSAVGPARTVAEAVPAQESTPPLTRPGGTLPAGTLPAGTLPAGTLPAGTLPAGTLPAGTLPAGTVPADTVPGDTVPAARTPAPAAPAP